MWGVRVLVRGVHVGCGSSSGNGAEEGRTGTGWVAGSGPVSRWDQEQVLKFPGSRGRGRPSLPSNLKRQCHLTIFPKNSLAI